MHKKARKQFAEDKQTKEKDYWNPVLWSDETKINSFGSDGVKRVWRQPGEEYKDKCVLSTVKHGSGSVMVRNVHNACRCYNLSEVNLWQIQLNGYDLERHTRLNKRSNGWWCTSEQKPSPGVKITACRGQKQVCSQAMHLGKSSEKILLQWRVTEACSLCYP